MTGGRRAQPWPALAGWLAWTGVGVLLCARFPISFIGSTYTLGPLFALLAWRRWGVLAGIGCAVAVSVPSLIIHMDGVRVLFIMGIVGMAIIGRRFGRLMVESAWLLCLLLIALRVSITLFGVAPMPNAPAMMGNLLTLIADTLQALAADAIVSNFRVQPAFPWVPWRRSLWLSTTLRMMINFIIGVAFMTTLQGENIELRGRMRVLQQTIRTSLQGATVTPIDAGGPFRRLVLPGGDETTIAIQRIADTGPIPRRVAVALCGEMRARERGRTALLPDWLLSARGCETDVIRRDGQRYLLVSRLQIVATEDSDTLPLQLYTLMAAMLFVVAFNLWLRDALRATLDATRETIRLFGTPNLPKPEILPFREFQPVLERFVERNNAYVAALAERDRLAEAARALQECIGLRVINDIRINPDAGTLRFTTISPDGQSQEQQMAVDPADRSLLRQAGGAEDALVEFRGLGSEQGSHLLNLRGQAGKWRWRSAVMVDLRQPRRLRELMMHQARLADLGGMASAICHELKQPLFTIDMAARSIDLIAAQSAQAGGNGPQLRQRSQRISEQVARTQDIITRIAAYGRVSLDSADRGDVSRAFEDAASFLEPRLHEEGISIDIAARPGLVVDVPRVALEQIMVNGLQNAIDAIVEARAKGRPHVGRIRFEASCTDGTVTLRLLDDGIGLGHDGGSSAFEPFYTTKPDQSGSGLGLFISRQIVMEAKGSISLAPRDGGGAVLTVSLPEARSEAAVDA